MGRTSLAILLAILMAGNTHAGWLWDSSQEKLEKLAKEGIVPLKVSPQEAAEVAAGRWVGPQYVVPLRAKAIVVGPKKEVRVMFEPGWQRWGLIALAAAAGAAAAVAAPRAVSVLRKRIRFRKETE